MFLNKKFYSLFFFLFLIFSFSSCENNGKENLFSEKENEILEGEFLEEKTENDLEKIFEEGEDFFEGAEFDSGKNDLGASLISNYDGNSFFVETGVDLHKISGRVNFGSGSELNAYYGDTLNGIKIAFSNGNVTGIFDSISYGGYGMENVSVLNGEIQFDIYFDGNDNSYKSQILRKLFTEEKDFLTQVKISQTKSDGKNIKIHSKVISQNAKNEEGGLLFKWPCLQSDFTSNFDQFRNNGEIFPKIAYEETGTGYILDLSGNWDKNNFKILNGTGYCALNDTYNFIKTNVIGSQCWEGETKNDVGRLVFRPKIGSFCTQAKSIEEEKYYPNYACNIESEKIGTLNENQEYLGGDIFPLGEIKFTCGEK